MKESHPVTFFLVHSALASEHAKPCKRPLGQPRADPPPPRCLSRPQELQPGGCGPFPVSSFHLASRVHPVTMAQDGSSVNRGGVPTLEPFLPGSGRGRWAWFWHRQRPAHACPRAICGAQARSTSSGTPVCPGHRAAVCSAWQSPRPQPPTPTPRGEARGQMACACAQRGVCARPLVPAKGRGPCGLSGHNLIYDKEKKGTPGAQGWGRGGRQ